MATRQSALEGIRVIEVGNFMAVPFCGMQLADLGADVIKVENPRGGDLTRGTGPFIEGESSNFVRLNRNKRSLALDLKSADGKAVFRRLVARADVVIENLRPGTMRDLGLSYETLSADAPRLIYLAATGFGSDGPYSEMAGLDIIAQGMSGLMSITGEPGAPPVKVGVPIADLTAALYATIAVLAARVGGLVRRVGGRALLRHRRGAAADRLGASSDRAVPGGPFRRRLLHLRRQYAGALAAMLRDLRTR